MHNVSIIVCTRNRAAFLRSTLESVTAVEVPADMTAEVVLVDNGSSDDTESVIRSFDRPGALQVRYVVEAVAGQTRARNAGVRAAAGEILLWTDDDVRVPSDWLVRMSGPLARGEADAVAGGIRITSALDRPWMTDAHRAWLAAFGEPSTGDRPAMIGANMGFRRQVLRRVPQFDEELGPGALGYADETLFFEQLMQAGFRFEFVPGGEVEHHFDAARLTRRSLLAAARKYGRSNAYLCHHWHHSNIRYPGLQIAKTKGLLALHRLRSGRPADEGISEREMGMRCYMHLCEEFRRIRRKPRKYDLHGLRKKEL